LILVAGIVGALDALLCVKRMIISTAAGAAGSPALGIADQVCRMLVTMVQLTTQVFKVLYAEPPGETLRAADRFCPDTSLSGKIF
jgi:hypothetical protein